MNTAPPPHPPAQRRAIVLGASMAGLLAARVLSESFDQVLLLERDDLPAGPAPRKGTPQALQPHGLLARGREALETLFPGLTASLIAHGAVAGDLGQNAHFSANGRLFARSDAGHTGVGVSRLLLESEVRRRVLALPNVTARTGVDVLMPVFDPDRAAVTGVRFAQRVEDGTPQRAREETHSAALVVDCSGRGSRAPQWLWTWGFDAVPEDRVRIGLMYVSAYFHRDAAAALPQAAVIAGATPSHPWPGVLIAQEPDTAGRARWVLGVGGYQGDHPAPSWDGLRQRAHLTGNAALIDLAENGRPIGPPQRYLFAHSQRRRYERLRRFPRGFLVMGDALCSFNPVYGQGMTVAACEALALRDALSSRDTGPRLAQRWFRACARLIDTPWQLAVGADLALPGTPGPRPLPVRLVNAYIACLYRAAPHDAKVALAFLRVVHLLAPPASLFRPSLLWRVWRGQRLAAADAGRASVGALARAPDAKPAGAV